MKISSIFPLALASLLLPATVIADDGVMDKALLDEAKLLADSGLHYLRQTQAEDGSWSSSVGVTALGLRAFLENRRGYTEGDGPFITRPVKFLLNHVNEDGSISETNQNRNYNTAVAITALQATNNPAYAEIIANAQRYIHKLQLDSEEGYEPDHKYYGGIGYGGDERPDLSNIYHSIEAMKITGFDANDPMWENALTFISRSQNNSETNDQEWASNDGGFAYMPGYSPHGGTVSYGSMTAAGLLSLLYAGADKNDPRVKAAYDWIRANYTVETNPGAKKNQGLFYYYNAFAKTMRAYGEKDLVDAQGVSHNWREDLTRQLKGMQSKDGSWVNNDSPRWWEGDKNLCTAWSVIALNQVINK